MSVRRPCPGGDGPTPLSRPFSYLGKPVIRGEGVREARGGWGEFGIEGLRAAAAPQPLLPGNAAGDRKSAPSRLLSAITLSSSDIGELGSPLEARPGAVVRRRLPRRQTSTGGCRPRTRWLAVEFLVRVGGATACASSSRGMSGVWRMTVESKHSFRGRPALNHRSREDHTEQADLVEFLGCSEAGPSPDARCRVCFSLVSRKWDGSPCLLAGNQARIRPPSRARMLRGGLDRKPGRGSVRHTRRADAVTSPLWRGRVLYNDETLSRDCRWAALPKLINYGEGPFLGDRPASLVCEVLLRAGGWPHMRRDIGLRRSSVLAPGVVVRGRGRAADDGVLLDGDAVATTCCLGVPRRFAPAKAVSSSLLPTPGRALQSEGSPGPAGDDVSRGPPGGGG